MKILITGASGFVGGALWRAARDAGHEVIALGRRDLPDRDYTRCDLTHALELDARPDVVVHAAARSSSQLGSQASAQQQKLASGLRSLGDELHSMSKNSAQPGVATDLVKQAAGRTHDIAQFLEDREPGHLVSELRDFARQRPVMFLAIAAGVGLLAGRVTRGVTASSDDAPAQSSTPAAHDATYAAPNGAVWAPPADLPVADYTPVSQYPADGLR